MSATAQPMALHCPPPWLSDGLPQVAEYARATARRLAYRIGDLGGAVTVDPGSLSTTRRVRVSSRSRIAPAPRRPGVGAALAGGPGRCCAVRV
jgi:hypothetical protein